MLFSQTESAFKSKSQPNAHPDNTWVTITFAMRWVNSVSYLTWILEFAVNVWETISWCIPENVFSKNNAKQDSSWSTTIVTTSAPLVETMTEGMENALTVPPNNTNYTMDYASHPPNVVPGNGLIKTRIVSMWVQNATHLTRQQVTAQAVSKVTTSWMEFAVWKVNLTLTDNVSMPKTHLKFQTKMDAERLSTELAVSDVMKNSSELKTISVFISANLYDAFTFIFLISFFCLINLIYVFIQYKYSTFK